MPVTRIWIETISVNKSTEICFKSIVRKAVFQWIYILNNRAYIYIYIVYFSMFTYDFETTLSAFRNVWHQRRGGLVTYLEICRSKLL